MVAEILAFCLYFTAILAIGVYFMVKSKKRNSEKEFFLGGRKMGPFVTALSAQASDMSGWLLMGLPGSVLLLGFGQVWVAIGLAIGSYLSWLLVAKRLRIFSQKANESITIPQYLKNRFASKSLVLQIVCAAIFFVCFTVYVASAFKAGAQLFSTVFGIESDFIPLLIFSLIVIAYTFTGGFKAVCWTDHFQAMLMICALLILPIVLFATQSIDFSAVVEGNSNYFNLLPSGKLDWESVSTILSGLCWGLGYAGMPHIIVRYMAIEKPSMIKTSRRVALAWVAITLGLAVLIGALGSAILPELLTNGNEELVFIQLVRLAFPAFIAGILLSAVLAASMSTADSQLLVASSAFTSDLYKPVIRKKASDKELVWVGRGVILVLAIIAFVIAILPGSGGIMDLVSNAWAGFGASFGPVIILSLYWKRFTSKGAIAGLIAGGLTVVLWIIFLSTPTGIYELLPGFIVGMAGCIIGSLLDSPPAKEIEELFDEAINDAINDIDTPVDDEQIQSQESMQESEIAAE